MIALDCAGDRYFELSVPLVRALDALAGGQDAAHPLVQRLLATGVLADPGAPIAPPSIPEASDSALEVTRCAESHGCSTWQMAAAVIGARRDLNRQGLAATLARRRRRGGTRLLAHDPEKAASLARGFDARRSLLPLRRLCLGDSLAISALLHRGGLAHDLVLGVRVAPFRAHAWVQLGTTVLNDRLDAVRGLVPILVQ